jgi:hypothetical protein
MGSDKAGCIFDFITLATQRETLRQQGRKATDRMTASQKKTGRRRGYDESNVDFFGGSVHFLKFL